MVIIVVDNSNSTNGVDNKRDSDNCSCDQNKNNNSDDSSNKGNLISDRSDNVDSKRDSSCSKNNTTKTNIISMNVEVITLIRGIQAVYCNWLRHYT